MGLNEGGRGGSPGSERPRGRAWNPRPGGSVRDPPVIPIASGGRASNFSPRNTYATCTSNILYALRFIVSRRISYPLVPRRFSCEDCSMEQASSSAVLAPLRPHSRTLCRGVIGDAIDGRSKEGRYLRAVEAELVDHLGGQTSTTQRIAIHRAARLMLRLEIFDKKLTAGEFTSHDARVYNALQNSLRLMLKELGMKPQAAIKPALSLADIAARHAKAEGAPT